MRARRLVSLAICAAVVGFVVLQRSTAQQVPADAPAAAPVATGYIQENSEKAKIVPVIVVKPGETHDSLFSTNCRIGVDRSTGLGVRELGGPEPSEAERLEAIESRGKIWRRNGLTITVPDYPTAEKFNESPAYAALHDKGLNVFNVRISAASDSKPGAYDIHVSDSTCSGQCHTNVRVLVVAP